MTTVSQGAEPLWPCPRCIGLEVFLLALLVQMQSSTEQVKNATHNSHPRVDSVVSKMCLGSFLFDHYTNLEEAIAHKSQGATALCELRDVGSIH